MPIKNKKEQRTRALVLFIMLVAVFAVCLYFLLAVQYQYWPWDKLDAIKDKAILGTFEPLKWMLASLIGAALYLLGQIAIFYPKINEKLDPDNQNDFINSTYWYITTLLRAPILTVVIMWLLTNLTINLGTPSDTTTSQSSEALGVAINFSKFPDLVKIGIAFILGFYGRVARKQLDIIAEYLFTRAWALAQMGFEIAASAPEVILLKDAYTFKTDPVMDVVWTSNMGTMEADTGTYKAPEDASVHGKDAFIRAQLRSEPSVTQVKKVKLMLFKISGESSAKTGDVKPLKLETKFDKIGEEVFDLAQADWTCTGGTLSANKGAEVTVTATATDVVKITATVKNYEAKFEIKIE